MWPSSFYRYLDDGFMIWTKSESELHEWVSRYNSMSPRIHIKVEIRRYSIDFLDVVIQKDISCVSEDVPLRFTTHQKLVNAYLYIPFSSQHPVHNFSGWVYGELVRYVYTCSRESDYLHMKQKFFTRLLARGYSLSWLENVAERVSYGNRQLYLSDARSRGMNDRNTVFLTTTYTREHMGIRLPSVVRRVVDNNVDRDRCPLQVVVGYRRAMNLGGKVVRAKHKP